MATDLARDLFFAPSDIAFPSFPPCGRYINNRQLTCTAAKKPEETADPMRLSTRRGDVKVPLGAVAQPASQALHHRRQMAQPLGSAEQLPVDPDPA